MTLNIIFITDAIRHFFENHPDLTVNDVTMIIENYDYESNEYGFGSAERAELTIRHNKIETIYTFYARHRKKINVKTIDLDDEYSCE